MATSESKMDTTTTGTAPVKKGLAQCLKGGVIMDVMNVEQARIAEQVNFLTPTTSAASRQPPRRRCFRRCAEGR